MYNLGMDNMPSYVKTTTTTVHLIRYDSSQEYHPFWCPYCKNMILKYSGDVVKISPGFYPSEFPIVVQCSNPKCRANFSFISFVEVQNNG